MSWTELTRLQKIPDGLSRWVKNRSRLVVVKRDSEIVSVFRDRCPHNNRIKISSRYDLDSSSITCRYHGACYRLQDGKQLTGPGNDGLETFPFRIVKDRLEIEFE